MIDFEGIRVGLFEPDFGALMARRSVLTLVDRFVARRRHLCQRLRSKRRAAKVTA